MKHIVTNAFHVCESMAFVQKCDFLLEERMENAISQIDSTKDMRLFGLTGPSCSGKTTTARKITEHMEKKGLRIHVISIDDFYYGLDYLKKRVDDDPDIEIDYDSEETIDIDLLEEVTENLLSCRKTVLPRFDFHTGKRTQGEEINPMPESVFLFEGIQVLYPKINAILNHSPSYRSIAICPTSEIECANVIFTPNEIRFFRRLVRDFRYRSTSPEFTFFVWKSVRENEEKNIFPNMHLCQAKIDSTMPYEIGMLKPYLDPLLKEIAKDSPYYAEAQRMLEKISSIAPISSDFLTTKSLYKEFI